MLCRHSADILQTFCRHSADNLQIICRSSVDCLRICYRCASRSVADYKQICLFPTGGQTLGCLCFRKYAKNVFCYLVYLCKEIYFLDVFTIIHVIKYRENVFFLRLRDNEAVIFLPFLTIKQDQNHGKMHLERQDNLMRKCCQLINVL